MPHWKALLVDSTFRRFCLKQTPLQWVCFTLFGVVLLSVTVKTSSLCQLQCLIFFEPRVLLVSAFLTLASGMMMLCYFIYVDQVVHQVHDLYLKNEN
jgi:hypothetical protein